jgi:hypothetical protein
MKTSLINIIFLFVLCFIYGAVDAQPENVRINNEAGIDELLNKHLYYNEVMKTVPGFRLQIFSGSGNFSKSNAVSERSRFIGRFPYMKAYIIFNTPYYLVRVGNFRTRLEAESFRQKILDVYPEAYIVRDDIDLPGNE